ncbi:hypothetical protein [Nocardiopsis synnemataformans]|uniref:hypothetical protein n=1 Tax=Nocardiopsis synnemataformans TaxID=61305 RepID=UPI003EBFE26D
MPRGVHVVLDRAGIRKILRSEDMAKAVNAAAERVAAHARALAEEEVTVVHYRTDRQAASVALAEASGANEQAVDGSLTKAARAAGLEVRPP